jgi:hypothetical protein
VTRASLREYAAVQRVRYQPATRADKQRLLDEIVAVTGLHRKAAIQLLGRAPRTRPTSGPGGRPRAYGPEVAAAAEVLWQASGRIGVSGRPIVSHRGRASRATQKLVLKTRHGARARRVYDRAQTPYQRLCATGVLTAAKRDELDRLYHTLNPLRLRRDLEAALDRLWPLAAPDPHRAQGDTEIAPPSLKSSPRASTAMAPVTLSYESTRTGG